jgi:hypothetical protein
LMKARLALDSWLMGPAHAPERPRGND